jgi:hypothetical protein
MYKLDRDTRKAYRISEGRHLVGHFKAEEIEG